jgi:hypothetical protein
LYLPLSSSLFPLQISLEYVPSSMASFKPVGYGREKPNEHPYLPKPVGRMSFHWNPCMMVYEVVGPEICKVLSGAGLIYVGIAFVQVVVPSFFANLAAAPIDGN